MVKCHLKNMLDARRMSIRQFAERIDYRFETVRKMYNDTLIRVPLDLMEKVCRELNISPSELFSIEDDTKDTKGG